jgi:hypothetical protein
LTAPGAVARFLPVKTPLLLVAATLVAIVACVAKDDTHQPVRTPLVLAGVPIPDVARVVDTVGTADAVRVVLTIAWPPDSVAAFYRRELPKAGFRIVGDLADSTRIDLYAQREGPPLWVQVRPARQGNGSEYTIIGAVGGAAGQGVPVTDSTKHYRSGSSMSSNRIHSR